MAKSKLVFNAAVEYKNVIYFSALYANGLFKLDLGTQEVQFLKRFERESICIGIHHFAFLYKNEAWFIPQLGNYIAIVNLNTLVIEYKELIYTDDTCSMVNFKYSSGTIIHNKYLYLIPGALDTLVIFDLEKKIVVQSYIVRKYSDQLFGNGFYNPVTKCIRLDPWRGSYSVIINLQEGTVISHEYEYQNNVYSGLYFDVCRQMLWRSPGKADHILVENLNTKEKHKLYIDNKYTNQDVILSNQILRQNNQLFMFGWETDVVINIDCKTNQVKYYELGVKNRLDNYYQYIFSNDYVMVSGEKSYFFVFDKKKDGFRKIPVEIDTNRLEDELNEQNLTLYDIIDTYSIQEGVNNLEYYMGHIMSKKNKESTYVGKTIWSFTNKY